MVDPGGFRDEAVLPLNELLNLAVGRHPSPPRRALAIIGLASDSGPRWCPEEGVVRGSEGPAVVRPWPDLFEHPGFAMRKLPGGFARSTDLEALGAGPAPRRERPARLSPLSRWLRDARGT